MIQCGDFCGDRDGMLPHRAATQRNWRQASKLFYFNADRRKLQTTKEVAKSKLGLLLINGLEVRVLPGSPNLSITYAGIIDRWFAQCSGNCSGSPSCVCS